MMKKIILATALAATMMSTSVFAAVASGTYTAQMQEVLENLTPAVVSSWVLDEEYIDYAQAAGPGKQKSASPAKVLKLLGIKNVKTSKLPGGGEVASFKTANTKVQAHCMMSSEFNLTCIAPRK